ncbi:MAG: phenylalanine--tRNA ligase subunit beta, partial [Paludibacteraceae bacterium]|nr:phenylalanine--tRNA ligase subunit beta [Paludibacteraceae bacterium]
QVADFKRCLRYSGVTLSGVTVKESPDWLKNRLLAIGQRPINNIVDVTNFIINELGQPLHAFDGDKIAGDRIIVKTLPEGTPFVTLDGVERKLSAEDLMICNAEGGMCMAGVFGGLDSGVTESTTKVFIESAYFDPVSIRKTARRHGLNTDASFRYERGCDPNLTVYALKRAALLVKEVAGGEISSEVTDLYPSPVPHFEVAVSYDKINRLTGIEIAPETVKRIVTGLEMEIQSETAEGLVLLVPPYRVDVQRDVDVIEDILRVYGYNQVPLSDHVRSSISYANKPDSTRLQDLLSNHLTGAGFNEILNNSLTKVSYYSNLQSYPEAQAVRIMNPLGSDLSVMRQTLLFGGLESIARNLNRKQTDLRFYEFGACYHYNADKASAEKPLAAYSEETHLALWLAGSGNANIWTDAERAHTFFDLKAQVINCLTRLGIPADACTTEACEADIFRQAIRITLKKNGKTLATLGSVSTKLLKAFDIETEVFYADIEWKQVLKTIGAHQILFTDIPKFPAVKRDLALLLDKNVSFEQVEQTAYDTDRKLLKKVVLFDVYEGKNLPAGKKSYAVSFTIQDTEKTLEDKHIDQLMSRLIKAFETKLGASIR